MRTFDQIVEELDWASESLGETVSQFEAETAMFGDGWPGAAKQIRDGKARVRELKAELAAVWCPLPYAHPVAHALDAADNACPF